MAESWIQGLPVLDNVGQNLVHYPAHHLAHNPIDIVMSQVDEFRRKAGGWASGDIRQEGNTFKSLFS